MLQISHSFEENVWETFTNLGAPEPSPSQMSDLVGPLPGFIKPFPTTVSPESVEYLQIHGALTLPSIPLQKALLQTFIECVLPCMPIVKWPSFLNIINARDGRKGHVSLLLFHAVMFSATTFIELEHLLKAGYLSRREAHEAYFQKTKVRHQRHILFYKLTTIQLLYQSYYESDALIIVQALLLMTHLSDTADVDDSKYWSEIAISVAQPIGLFQEQSSPEYSLYCPRLWKRIGWACYMTDCLISLRLRCRPSIKKENFGHQMLTVDDFEFYDLPSENQLLDPECTLVHNVKVQRDMALICISHARLCVCISEVLEIQGKNNQLHSSSAAPITSINRENNRGYIAKVIMSDRALIYWINSLPPSCQYSSLALRDINNGDSTLFVQRSLLHMIYYTVISVLHQSQTFPSSSIRVHYAARQITKIASELHKRSLHNCLSVIGVTAILVAIIIHISEMRTRPSLEREEAMEDLQSCMSVMTSFQDLYSETKALTAWMFQAMEKVAMDGGSASQFYEKFPSSDLTVNPCSVISMLPTISVPRLMDEVALNS